MDSDEDPDKTHRQVIDYYKNYSKTVNLHKYFSNNPLPIKSPASQKSENVSAVDSVESGDNTPVSDRRLEWDNGADIGYHNCQTRQNLFKSSSLPTLQDIQHIKVSFDFINKIRPKDVDIRDTSNSNDSSSTKDMAKADPSSTNSSSKHGSNHSNSGKSDSNSGKSDNRDVKQFKATLEYLKRKIGLPETNSTPKSTTDRTVSSVDSRTSAEITPVRSDSEKNLQIKCVELTVTEPVSLNIEEARLGEESTQTDKNVDSLSVASVSVQTSKMCIPEQVDKATSVTNLNVSQNNSSKKDLEESSLDDVDKIAKLLSKLIKSSNSSANKKRIKEVFKKIKVSEESSTSSELFFPRKVIQNEHGKDIDKVSSSKSHISSIIDKNESPTNSTESSQYKNWRDDKTVSERHFDSNRTSNYEISDAVQRLVCDEKAWIDKKNRHLTKLKTLLEDFEGVRRSVYTVRSTTCNRNYVIETQLAASDKSNTQFVFNGECYRISGNDGNSPVLGGINVETKGNTTNIKVKTVCATCQSLVCVCKSRSLSGKEDLMKDDSSSSYNSFKAAFDSCQCGSKCEVVGKFLKHFGAKSLERKSKHERKGENLRSIEHVGIQTVMSASNRQYISLETQTEVDVKDISVQVGEQPDQFNIKSLETEGQMPKTQKLPLKSVSAQTSYCMSPTSQKSQPQSQRVNFGASNEFSINQMDDSHSRKHKKIESTKAKKYCNCVQPRSPKDKRAGVQYTLTLKDDINLSKQKKLKERENHNQKDCELLEKWYDGVGESHNSKRDRLTLSEYLIINRPEFIKSSEFRRLTLYNSRLERENRKEIIKLRIAENNHTKPDFKETKRLFSEKEMKNITKKNYKKLPEIQKKLYSQRENRLRTVDKLITNMFNKKVQKSVLKGQINFPIDSNLI